MAVSFDNTKTDSLASTGPRFMKRGNAVGGDGIDGVLGASTGPRFMKRGNTA